MAPLSAPLSKLQRRLPTKLLQHWRRRRKASQQKILHLLQAGRVLLLQICFPTTLLFYSENFLFDPVKRRRESTKHGPPPWTVSIKIWTHQNMDRVHGPPIFTTPKITEVNNIKIKMK